MPTMDSPLKTFLLLLLLERDSVTHAWKTSQTKEGKGVESSLHARRGQGEALGPVLAPLLMPLTHWCKFPTQWGVWDASLSRDNPLQEVAEGVEAHWVVRWPWR
jgi:hypothetical protein